jgi:hypothetical protein
MKANDPLGIATYSIPQNFPVGTQRAFIVFADPDGCFSLSDWAGGCGVEDETFLEFTPTINLPGLEQRPVDSVLPARLGGAPQLRRMVNSPDWSLESVGPRDLGTATGSPCGEEGAEGCDNYGYGASPNLPGLVILSNRGVGLVWDNPETFSLAWPRRARNLAGMVNSVAWTLNDCEGLDRCETGRSGVTAHMNVPPNLFGPIARLDLGKQLDGVTTGRAIQIDGGRWVPDNNFQLVNTLRQIVTTVRVFVVNGRAPDELVDMDGNGVVTAEDAVRAGYKLLSGVAVLRLRTYYQSYTKGTDIATPYDHNGDGMDGDVIPGGAGGVIGIPR